MTDVLTEKKPSHFIFSYFFLLLAKQDTQKSCKKITPKNLQNKEVTILHCTGIFFTDQVLKSFMFHFECFHLKTIESDLLKNLEDFSILSLICRRKEKNEEKKKSIVVKKLPKYFSKVNS